MMIMVRRMRDEWQIKGVSSFLSAESSDKSLQENRNKMA